MEYSSTLNVVSRSLSDIQKVFRLFVDQYGGMKAWVWRSVPSYDEMDKCYIQMEIDDIYWWAPHDADCNETMEKIARILGKDGFAFLEIGNSVSPDYQDYKVTTSHGECKSLYDQEDGRRAMWSLRNSYSEDLLSIFSKSKDGRRELWNNDRQAEPPMPYKVVRKPARTHEQVVQDDYLYRRSDAAVAAFRSLLENKKDLNAVYEAFRKQFEDLKSDPDKLDKQDLYIVTRDKNTSGSILYEKASLGTRLERAEQFSFRGKIFHIHGNSLPLQYMAMEIDPTLKKLACMYEDDLRLAIARRGGIIDDYDGDYNRLRYTDCCVMVDNEDQRYHDGSLKFINAVCGYGVELITRFAVWYAITCTPELSKEELEELGKSSFYLDAVEARNTKVLEADKALKADNEERIRNSKVQEEKDFAELMTLLREKYSEDKAASCSQIEIEVRLGDYPQLRYWAAVHSYIKGHYNTTTAAYFKQEGLIGKKAAAKKEPEKKAPAPQMVYMRSDNDPADDDDRVLDDLDDLDEWDLDDDL